MIHSAAPRQHLRVHFERNSQGTSGREEDADAASVCGCSGTLRAYIRGTSGAGPALERVAPPLPGGEGESLLPLPRSTVDLAPLTRAAWFFRTCSASQSRSTLLGCLHSRALVPFITVGIAAAAHRQGCRACGEALTNWSNADAISTDTRTRQPAPRNSQKYSPLGRLIRSDNETYRRFVTRAIRLGTVNGYRGRSISLVVR